METNNNVEEQKGPQSIPAKLWSIQDVSAFLQVKESAIRHWVYEKRIRFYKIGALIRFVPEEIFADVVRNRIGQIELDKENSEK